MKTKIVIKESVRGIIEYVLKHNLSNFKHYLFYMFCLPNGRIIFTIQIQHTTYSVFQLKSFHLFRLHSGCPQPSETRPSGFAIQQ